MLINDLTQTMHQKSKEIVAIYEDSDASFKTENAVTNGSLALQSTTEGQEKGEETVWDNFYSKLEEIDVSNLLVEFVCSFDQD